MTWSQLSPRERDALVAEKVMGIPQELISINGPIDSPYNPGTLVCEIDYYTTSIEAAWEVVEKLTSIKTPYFMLVICDAYSEKTQWQAEFDMERPYKRVTAQSDSAPEAICLAALKALGVEVS